MEPLIFDIKRYAINDGPGIRMTIFTKGCPLSCVWCHNPESQSPHGQKMYNADKCIGCQSCVDACPENACKLTPNGIVTDPELCTVCGKCADVCPTKASEVTGRRISREEILAKIGTSTAIVMQSHGVYTISDSSVYKATVLAAEVEEIAKIAHLAMLQGQPTMLTPEQVKEFQEIYHTLYGN